MESFPSPPPALAPSAEPCPKPSCEPDPAPSTCSKPKSLGLVLAVEAELNLALPGGDVPASPHSLQAAPFFASPFTSSAAWGPSSSELEPGLCLTLPGHNQPRWEGKATWGTHGSALAT